MGKYIKTLIPACVGASVGVSFVSYFRHPDLWGIGDFMINLLVTFIVTTIVVFMCFWIWSRIKSK